MMVIRTSGLQVIRTQELDLRNIKHVDDIQLTSLQDQISFPNIFSACEDYANIVIVHPMAMKIPH